MKLIVYKNRRWEIPDKLSEEDAHDILDRWSAAAKEQRTTEIPSHHTGVYWHIDDNEYLVEGLFNRITHQRRWNSY